MPFSLEFSSLLKILKTSSFELALGIYLINDLVVSENPFFLMFLSIYIFFSKKIRLLKFIITTNKKIFLCTSHNEQGKTLKYKLSAHPMILSYPMYAMPHRVP